MEAVLIHRLFHADNLAAWFKSGLFWVTVRTVRGLARTASCACSAPRPSEGRRSVPQGIRQTEQFQPVGMRLAGQQFRWAAVDALGVLAAEEAAVVEEELQQVQIIRSQVTPQEEIVPQAAVEVLDHGTGSDRAARHCRHRLAQVVETPAQL